jgi:hypothetical protein
MLADHLGRYFEALDVGTIPCVGLVEAMGLAVRHDVDAVICDYDLLATNSLDGWENDPLASRIPVIAVSLTRHPGEAHVLDVNGIAGFLYLPTLDPEAAQRMLATFRREAGAIHPPHGAPWPGPRPAAQLR